MKRKIATAVKYEGPIFPPGSDCLIHRPHLWANCTGVVKSVENGIHRVWITAKDGATYPGGFHADVSGELLSVSI